MHEDPSMPESELEFTAPDLFAAPLANAAGLPRVWGSCARYVQGPGVFGQMGHYANRLGFSRCGVLLSQRSHGAEGGAIIASLESEDVGVVAAHFHGECTRAEIEAQAARLRATEQPVDAVVAIGGGKVIDAGRAVAHRLGVPVIVAPTLASNDAPGACLSVIYTEDGATEDAEIYDANPALVIIDSIVVAQAAPRYLAAGIADALATWYEARATRNAPMGVTVFGAAPTRTGTIVARHTAELIYENGAAAMAAVTKGVPDAALEDIIEANTLLSSLGVENGGLALAHAVAQGYSLIPAVHDRFLHGEMVAMGIVTQLAAEGDRNEAEKAAGFLSALGLPVCLDDLGLSSDSAEIGTLIAGTMAFPFLGNLPFEMTAERTRQAVVEADRIGQAQRAAARQSA
ncbi:glycerol dehydrogenase [Novosphingobium sp. ZN18A2]|uniref:glycerol dehydrogenase n=1 Tax=Novosphingobium sp. ZN18A2 TaxID=3079861 RepID=UPI0030CC6B10